MTQNLRCGYIRDERDGRDNMIRTRQHRFKKLVEKYDPDMIALQECTTGWLGLLEDGIWMIIPLFINGLCGAWI